VRVALVIERFEPHGGVEQVAWQVAHGLAAAGDDVHVVARRADAAAGVHVTRTGGAVRWQPWRVLAFSRAAARAAPRGRFDVVHSFSRTRHQDLYRDGGGSHADFLERRFDGAARAWRRLSPRHRVLLAIERRVFADASQHVQCNSRMVRAELQRRWGLPDARVSVVYNGVDLERFDPARHRAAGERLRATAGADGAPLWLFVGSGFERKGLDTALAALAKAPGSLWIAGADDTTLWRRRAAELGVADRVRWLGLRRDVEVLYAACDALLLPTRYDAFANVCLEAAAAGRPVVTSADNGAAEILADAGAVIADAGDADAFAAALSALADPVAQARSGECARAVAERFSWGAHVAALRALYARIAR
jgi:UDP-glucose:(heptosyl)LPS alpha-1,3-glucosyltransferase